MIKFSLIATVVLNAAVAHSAERRECTGRLVFALPSEAEVAGASFEEMKRQILEPSAAARYTFGDGEEAWSSRLFFTGPMLVSGKLEKGEAIELSSYFNQVQKSRGRPVDGLHNGWASGRAVRLLLENANSLVMVNVAGGSTLELNQFRAKALAHDVVPRSVFSIPDEPGLCFPNSFVKTSSYGEYRVSATYKLTSHPDITVWISEVSSATKTDPVREKDASPRNVINSFWSQYEISDGVTKIEAAEPDKNGQAVKLAGRSGLASYTKIFRSDGAEDYGYYASAKGAAGDDSAPDINVYVLSNSKFAKDRGLLPVEHAEFMKIVEVVQDSLSLRKNE